MANPEEILAFWLDQIGPKGWYKGDAALDDEIRTRFQSTWDEAMTGAKGLWLTHASGTLAYIILTDQLPRNMFRGTAQAFASDKMARAASKIALSRSWDVRIDEPARQFFYMPLLHSENLCDQDRGIRLMATRMPDSDGVNLLHAQAHRDIIRQFGRFPFRNDALGRASTTAEKEYMAAGGYMSTVRALEAAAA